MVTHEIARRLVEGGDEVEWFTASYPGALAEETIDGVRVIRRGRQWTVHWHAFRRYRGQLSERFDVVVDEVNTIPFFAPLWSSVPVVVFIHQLAKEVWWYESPFPLNLVGYLAEPRYLRCYRNVAAVTVSASTRADLLSLGFRGPITVVPEGLEPIAPVQASRPVEPALLYVGRIAPSKRVSDVVRAFAQFYERTKSGRLTLLGEGSESYMRKLESLAVRLGVSSRVRFMGRVPAAMKHEEMASAHVLLIASVREGWGLVVTEANAVGTPAIGYDVPGLRDSIRHEETGLLVRPTPDALADALAGLWNDREKYERLSAASRVWGDSFSFDSSAQLFRHALTISCAHPGTLDRTPTSDHVS